MSDLNYGLGFYLIEVAANQYDLFNSATDNRILKAEPEEKIINFLELNLPTHPFLYQVDQETGLYLPADKSSPEGDRSTDVTDTFYVPQYNYNNYTGTSIYGPDIYSSFNYDVDYKRGFVESEDEREEGDSVQLEFDFIYKDSKDKEITSPNNSPDHESIMNEYFGEDIPYLPDDTDGDTEQGKNINKGRQRLTSLAHKATLVFCFYIYME